MATPMNGAVQGGRRDGGQRAREEGAGVTWARSQSVSDAGESRPDDEQARQAQREREQQVGERGHYERRLELKAPADLGAAGPARRSARRRVPRTMRARRPCRPCRVGESRRRTCARGRRERPP
jgi:hypothetical protein